MADFSGRYDKALVGTVDYGDVLMSNGDLVLTADADSRGANPVLQDLLFRLRTFSGECFVNTSLGVPWYQQLIGQTGNPGIIDAVLQNVVLATPGVLQLTEWSSSFDRARRILSISFAALTTSGQVVYSAPVSLSSQGATS